MPHDIYKDEGKPGIDTKPVRKDYGEHKGREHLHREKGAQSLMSAYCYYPDGVRFVGVDGEEKIVLFLRKHPITNVRWILVAIIMVFTPLLVSFLPGVSVVPIRFQLVGILIWYLITMAFIFEEFLGWFFNVYIITDERVFDVDFVNLVYREITDANIDQIQDVTTTLSGALRTMLHFGDVFIQTSAEIPQIEFKDVPHPDRVASVLRDLRVEEEQEKIEGRVR